MPTFLDLTLGAEFGRYIFPFILVWVLIYALLEWRGWLGKDKGIHAIIALSIAFITLISGTAIEIINIMAPWYVILFVFLLFLLMTFKLFGVSDDAITKIGSKETVVMWIIVLSLAIFVTSVGYVYSGSLISTDVVGVNGTIDGNSAEGAVIKVLFHPAILGTIFILILAAFLIRLLAN